MSNDLFLTATREAWRFPSAKGQLSVEQLWQLPLINNRDKFDLDGVAKLVNADVKQQSEESFVTPTKTDNTPRLKLDLVRYIIQVKLDERTAATNALAKAEERKKILDILDRKTDAALEATSVEDLKARLKQLEA